MIKSRILREFAIMCERGYEDVLAYAIIGAPFFSEYFLMNYDCRHIQELHYPAYSLTRLEDGTLVSGQLNGDILFWDPNTFALKSQWERAHQNRIYTLSSLPGNQLASGSWDDTVKIWNANTGENIHTFPPLFNSPRCMLKHPSAILIVGYHQSAIVGYKLNSYTLLSFADPSRPHLGEIRALSSLTDDLFASASTDGTIKIWDLHSRECVTTIMTETPVYALTRLNQSYFASGHWDNSIQIWNIDNVLETPIPTPEHLLSDHQYSVRILKTIDDQHWISGSRDNTIKIWNGFTCIQTLSGHQNWIRDLAILPSGKIVSASDDATLRWWSAD